ncbi:hypothetical protein FACS1894201_07460 [Bacteroidia bacterium]|nr:hypothetical protein FACS1894201_07460 [Bacteroidia bacterium]
MSVTSSVYGQSKRTAVAQDEVLVVEEKTGYYPATDKIAQDKKVKDLIVVADENFEKSFYHKAFGYYKNAFDKTKEPEVKRMLYLKIGEIQHRLDHNVEARWYFDRAYEVEGVRERGFLMAYGDVLLKTANYNRADSIYLYLLRADPSNVLLKNKLKSCEIGRAYKDSVNALVAGDIKRQVAISSNASDYGLAIVDNNLIFSSTRRAEPPMLDMRTGQGFSHLYKATPGQDLLGNIQWKDPKALSFNIYGDAINDGVFSYDKVNKIGYFQRCNEGNCGIYTTVNEGKGNWSIPEPLEVNGVGVTSMVGQPAISPDGTKLIFVTKGEGGQGGSDLWLTTKKAPSSRTRRVARVPTEAENKAVGVSKKMSAVASRQTKKLEAAPTPTRTRKKQADPVVNASWDVPVNLGKYVNTPGNEVFPVWLNEDAFSFSSDGHPGLGGLDMFIATRNPETKEFTQVDRVQAPINSSFDDYNFVVSEDLGRIFFASSRFGQDAQSDGIYDFPKMPGSMEINLLVRDVITKEPITGANVTICPTTKPDSCSYFVSDTAGRVKYYDRRSEPTYTTQTTKYTYLNSNYTIQGNPALQIIPTEFVVNKTIDMHPDEALRFNLKDSIPVDWRFFAETELEDTINVVAVAIIDSMIKLFGLNNTCVENFSMTLIESPWFRVLPEPVNYVDAPMKTFDSNMMCDLYHYEDEAYFTQRIRTLTHDPYDIHGSVSYMVQTPFGYRIFKDVPLTVHVIPPPAPEDTSVPAVQWFCTAIQTPMSNNATLQLKGIIKENYILFSQQQQDSLIMPITFYYTADSANYQLVGTTKPAWTHQSVFDSVIKRTINYYKDSVIFNQQVSLHSSTDFKIIGSIDYMVQNLRGEADYRASADVPTSFPIVFNSLAGKETQPTTTQIDNNKPTNAPLPQRNAPNDIWASKHKSSIISVQGPFQPKQHYSEGVNECMKPGMTPEEIIECLDRHKTYEEATPPNYQLRENYGVPCQDCDSKPKRHRIVDDLYLQSNDDKKTLRLTDQLGQSTYIDLAPNMKYHINVQSIITAGGDDLLPTGVEQSDIIKAVRNKDYVVYECMPKLAELGDEVYINNLYYDFNGKSFVKDGQRELDRLIVVALRNPHYTVEIETNADERGSAAYNQALTESRLTSITRYLEEKGLDVSHFKFRAMGKNNPLIKGAKTDEEHALNRRATIRLYDNTRRNTLPVNYEAPENSPLERIGLYFRVQLGAYRVAPEYPKHFFKDVYDLLPGMKVEYYQDNDGLYKFTVGEFTSPDMARRIYDKLQASNRDAYIVAFNDGQRITMNEAQVLIYSKQRKKK